MEDIKDGKYIYKNNGFNSESFLKRSTIISGQSGTGKSYILNSILASLAAKVGRMYAFSATADADETFPYDEYTFPQLIYKELDMQVIRKIHMYLTDKSGLIRKLKKKEIISRYAKITIGILMKYQSKFTSEERQRYENLKKLAKNTGSLIRKTAKKLQDIKTKNEKDKILGKIVSMYVEIVVKGGKLLIDKVGKITHRQLKSAYDLLIFNPFTIIVINDLSNDLKALKGDDLKFLSDVFDYGRHVGMIPIILMHDWAKLKKELRNAAHNFIFTSLEMANNFVSIQNHKGAMAKDFNRAADIVIGKDRQLPDSKKRYTALFWMRLTNSYEYLVADPEGKQVGVGLKYWHDLAQKKRNKEKRLKDLF